MPINALVPDAAVLVGLEPEEIGGVILEAMHQDHQPSFSIVNYFRSEALTAYPAESREAVSKALAEGVGWLRAQVLIADNFDQQQGAGWCVITRRGRTLTTRAQVRAYRAAAMFPETQLHARIVTEAKDAFIRGDYDTAVFQSFREVEIAVRGAGGFAATDLGVELMRRAFGENGPLTKGTDPVPEQQALAHLFAGAIGSYKNPHSHRNVAVDAQDALEIIVLASHLLRIVDARLPEV